MKKLDILGELDKVMQNKTKAKIVKTETMSTVEEIYLELEQRMKMDGESDFTYKTGAWLVVYRNSDNEVVNVIVEGGYSPNEWQDITAYIKGLK